MISVAKNTNKVNWSRPTTHPLLGANEVHVWKASLRVSKPQLSALTGALSSSERARATSYRLGEDRNRFIAARGLLKTILAGYLDIPSGEVRISSSCFGKPELAADSRIAIHFNMSHSYDRGLFAIARAFDVGIDIERCRIDCPVDSIAEASFSSQERAALSSLPLHLKHRLFFTFWTRNEALAKGIGCGLRISLDDWVPDPLKEMGEWSLIDLPLGRSYQAALAIRTREVTLRYWDASAICPLS